MTLKETRSKFILNDGQIMSCLMKFGDENSITVSLKVREKVGGEINDVELELKFQGIIELYISEDLSSRFFSDITLVHTESQEFYLSLDPYDNTNSPDLRDNFVIKSKMLEILKMN